MKAFLFTLFFIFNTIILQAQSSSVSGYLYDDDGEPIIGATVIVKKTNRQTITDNYGYYSFDNLNEGDVLIFKYLGMEDKSITVADLKKNEKRKSQIKIIEPEPSSELASLKDAPGVAYLTDSTPGYEKQPEVNYLSGFKLNKNNTYSFKYRKSSKPKGFQLQFRTLLGLDVVGQLPELQSDFAQGQTDGNRLQWYGPESQEIFSWGPEINSLEYDGSNYPYDKNGKLVPSGSGDGKKANIYDSTDFFGTGFNIKNELSAKFSGFNNDVISLNLMQSRRTGAIPESNSESYNITLGIDDLKMSDELYGNANISYNYSQGDLLNRGSNLATIMSSVLTTPVTFDNANGLSRKDAVKKSEAWLLNDGNMRSYSPAYSDNPYALVNGIPDNENMHHLLTSAIVKYIEHRGRGFYGSADISYEQQRSKYVNGTLPGSEVYPDQRYSEKQERFSDLKFGVDAFCSLPFDSYWGSKKLILNLSYHFDRQEGDISGNDMFTFSKRNYQVDNSLQRNIHEIKYGGKYTTKDLVVDLSNRHYFSNTISSGSYSNIFPYLGVRYNPDLYYYFNNDLKLEVFGNVSRSLREASLIYQSPAVLSTIYKSSEFKNYYEYTDIFSRKDMNPEIHSQLELGGTIGLWDNRLRIETQFFKNTISDFIVPVLNESTPVLTNAAKVNNTGGSLALTWSYYRVWRKYMDVRLQISRAKSEVNSLNLSGSFIPLAGFSDIATVLAENKPVGAIYGSTYQRNDKGQVVIGNDGYPLVDNSLKMIGDPTPDFIANLSPSFLYNKFELSFSMEYRHGGDKWNGTNAALDYYGMSKSTGALRNTKGYVFDGVDVSGNKNTQAVDFYNPALPLSQNRWVRYGFSGVGEENIEDASYFRLSEVLFSYNAIEKGKNRLKINTLKFVFSARNLLLITRYKGVDPTSNLFGYNTGSGLDLFNLPGAKSYNLSVILGF